jgi:carboxymethylenebutenolidase
MVGSPADGRTAGGYLSAAPEGAGLGVVVVHDRQGLDDHVKDVCDRFAAEGCTALAPDLYHGPTVAHGDAGPSARVLDLDRVPGELSGAVDYLLAHRAVRGHTVGVVGFGVGGGLALWLATLRPEEVAAAVPFYGLIPSERVQPDYARMKAAVEGHEAANDDLAGPAAAEKLEATLVDLGKDVRTFVYLNTSRGFFDDTRRDVYDEDAARQAWVRTLEFLRSKLG